MKIKNRIVNLNIEIRIALYVNKELQWSDFLKSITINKFNIWNFEQRLIDVINEKDALRKDWEIIIRIIYIKIKYNRAKYEQQSINEFSKIE